MARPKSTQLDPKLVALAIEQANVLKGTLTLIVETTFRSTKGKKALNKNGRLLAKEARNAAVTYPEILPGVFETDQYDIRMNFDEQTDPLMSLINDTVDTFVKARFGNSADIEYQKRQIYNALVAGAKDDDQYIYYRDILAAEYEGQGKRSDEDDKGSDKPPKK